MKTDFWIWVIIDIKRTFYQFHQIKMRINDSGWNFQCFVCVRSDRFVLLPLIAMLWVWLKEGVNTLSKIWNVLVNFGIFQKVSAILEGNFVELNGLRFTFVLMFDFLTWSCKILANYSHIRNCMKFLSSFFRKTKRRSNFNS